MNILKQNEKNIKGILTGFDRIVINGFSRQLNNCRQFLFYMIQNNCDLVNFNDFALEHTTILIILLKKIIYLINILILQNQVKTK